MHIGPMAPPARYFRTAGAIMTTGVAALWVWTGICISPAMAETRVKADNATALNNTNSWVGRVVPGSGDIARWDQTVVTNGTVSLGSTLTWGQVAVVDPAVDIALQGNFLNLNGVAGTGLDLSAATVDLALRSYVVLGAPQTWAVAEGRRVIVGTSGNSAELQAVAGNTLTKTGAGTLTLRGVSGNSSYHAMTRVLEGSLELDKDMGNVVAIGGGGLVIGDTNDAPPAARVVLTGASYNLMGGSAITINKTGVFDTDGHGEDGAGAVRLYGTNDTCGVITNSAGGGNTLVMASTLTFVGGGSIDLGTGTTVRLSGHVTYTNAPDGRAARLAGLVALNLGTLTFTVADDLALPVEVDIPATITGNNNLAKSGAGTLRVSGNNLYTGTTTVNGPGVLRISGSNALGVGSSTTVNSGGALEVDGGVVSVEPLTLNGFGVDGGGALRSLAGDNTIAGTIGLGSAVHIQADAGTLTLAAGSIINSAQNLSVGGPGDIRVARPLQTGARTVTKTGGGTLTLAATNTYSGTTTVLDGRLLVDGRLTASPVRVESGAVLGGSGVIVPGVTNAVGGCLAPGGAPGALSCGLLALESGSRVELEFQGGVEAGNDQILVTASNGLSIGTDVAVHVVDAAHAPSPWREPGSYNLVQFRGAIQGAGVGGLRVGNPVSSASYSFSVTNDWIVLTIQDAITGLSIVVR